MAISGDYFKDNMKEVVKQVAEGGGGSTPISVTPIADPSTATAEDVANKVNEIITALS